tara:strand:+ start:101 stop:307 length:207 start_codon:yes stop_codon:yes gene_type:complete
MNEEISIDVRAVYDTTIYVTQADYDRAEREYIADYGKKPDREEVLNSLVWDNLDEVTNDSPELEILEY